MEIIDKNKNYCIKSYRFVKEPTYNKALLYQIKVCKFLNLNIMRDLLARKEKKNQCSIINKFCTKDCVTKFQHKKTRNLTIMLRFPRYRTYLLICCAIH